MVAMAPWTYGDPGEQLLKGLTLHRNRTGHRRKDVIILCDNLSHKNHFSLRGLIVRLPSKEPLLKTHFKSIVAKQTNKQTKQQMQ